MRSIDYDDLTYEERELLDNFRSISEDHQQALVRVATYLANHPEEKLSSERLNELFDLENKLPPP